MRFTRLAWASSELLSRPLALEKDDVQNFRAERTLEHGLEHGHKSIGKSDGLYLERFTVVQGQPAVFKNPSGYE